MSLSPEPLRPIPTDHSAEVMRSRLAPREGLHLAVVPTAEASAAAALLRAVVAGDPAAWSEVVGRYHRLLHHVTRQLGLRPDQRDDVVQSTWLRLVERAADIRSPEALPAWLVTTALREAMALRRRCAREEPLAELPEASAPTDDADEAVHLSIASARLHEQVARLPLRERCVIEALMAPDRPRYAEIALRLAMPVGAIGPVRQRALRRLAPLLDGCWQG